MLNFEVASFIVSEIFLKSANSFAFRLKISQHNDLLPLFACHYMSFIQHFHFYLVDFLIQKSNCMTLYKKCISSRPFQIFTTL